MKLFPVINNINQRPYSGENSLLGASQMGHTKSSGKDSKSTPGAMPLSGTPSAGSYIHPQILQTYFFIIQFLKLSLYKVNN